MTSKEWLNRGKNLNDEINSLLIERAEVFSNACSTTSTIKQDVVQTSRKNSSEKWFIKYADYTTDINRMTDKLVKIREETLNTILIVQNDTYKKLLIEKYVNFKTWREIAGIIGKTEINTRTRLHRSALKAITQYIV